jgi:TolA-binding protein
VERWVSGILAALLVTGVSALVVVYGDVGKLQSDAAAMRRELIALENKSSGHGEAVARLEERARCAH